MKREPQSTVEDTYTKRHKNNFNLATPIQTPFPDDIEIVYAHRNLNSSCEFPCEEISNNKNILETLRNLSNQHNLKSNSSAAEINSPYYKSTVKIEPSHDLNPGYENWNIKSINPNNQHRNSTHHNSSHSNNHNYNNNNNNKNNKNSNNKYTNNSNYNNYANINNSTNINNNNKNNNKYNYNNTNNNNKTIHTSTNPSFNQREGTIYDKRRAEKRDNNSRDDNSTTHDSTYSQEDSGVHHDRSQPVNTMTLPSNCNNASSLINPNLLNSFKSTIQIQSLTTQQFESKGPLGKPSSKAITSATYRDTYNTEVKKESFEIEELKIREQTLYGGARSFQERVQKGRETDPRRLEQRQKQINMGKNTAGYAAYTKAVTRAERIQGDDRHPVTPNKTRECSKRSFDGLIKKWRKLLHKWDPSGDITLKENDFTDLAEIDEEFAELERMINEKEQNLDAECDDLSV
jgi:hypothetical protein